MNKKYLVDTITGEYLCVAILKGQLWKPSNEKSLPEFMESRQKDIQESELISGEYKDNAFFEKWIRNGTNYLFSY